MKLHANARLSLKGRELLVERVEVDGLVAERRPPRRPGSASARARKWLRRYRARGRSRGCWTAHRRRGRSPTAPTRTAVEAIAALRRLRFTGAEIAEVLGMALSTVSGILTRIGLGKLGRLGPGARAALRAREAR